jgi:hypothetical protein
MANNYLQFSEQIESITPQQKKWITDYLRNPEDDPNYAQADGKIDWDAWAIDHRGVDADDWPGFDYSFDDKDNTLWLHGDEYGNIDHLQIFIQAYFKKFRPKGLFKLTYAETCSKPRLGEFGGGALVVTADQAIWWGAHAWVSEQLAKLCGKNRAKKRGKRTGKSRQSRRRR